ncbi:MAG: ComF family protein [Chloroflexi bacterium]|nr:ComF family protein [Chloroflexota bacterium]
MLLDFFFPEWCVGCGRGGGFLCNRCQQHLPRIASPVCIRCGRPQPGGTACIDCMEDHVAIDGIRSPLKFEGSVRQAIHHLKYRNLRALAAPLAGLLHEYLLTQAVPADVLAPVPLHPKRLRERGYNQSELLARELGKLTGLPVVSDCLVRRRQTLPQARTPAREQRLANVADAFACRRDVKGLRVLLIDDVCTSGATFSACAAPLKASGAISVWGLAAAREI